MTHDPELHRPIHSTDVPKGGVNQKILATEEECQLLALRLDVERIEGFKAHVKVTRWRRDGLKVMADIHADVVQNCVVSLEPIASHLEEQAVWHFKPEARFKSDDKQAKADELLIDPMGEDPADPLVDGVIDLGEILIEHLCLMIDPFARSPEADFEEVYKDAGTKDKLAPDNVSPFAVLKEMVKTPKK